MNKTGDGSGTLILVRCITHMRQILLQVFVYLFHNFILIDNKIDKNLKLRLYWGATGTKYYFYGYTCFSNIYSV